jgi:hypothetical protein
MTLILFIVGVACLAFEGLKPLLAQPPRPNFGWLGLACIAAALYLPLPN